MTAAAGPRAPSAGLPAGGLEALAYRRGHRLLRRLLRRHRRDGRRWSRLGVAGRRGIAGRRGRGPRHPERGGHDLLLRGSGDLRRRALLALGLRRPELGVGNLALRGSLRGVVARELPIVAEAPGSPLAHNVRGARRRRPQLPHDACNALQLRGLALLELRLRRLQSRGSRARRTEVAGRVEDVQGHEERCERHGEGHWPRTVDLLRRVGQGQLAEVCREDAEARPCGQKLRLGGLGRDGHPVHLQALPSGEARCPHLHRHLRGEPRVDVKRRRHAELVVKRPHRPELGVDDLLPHLDLFIPGDGLHHFLHALVQLRLCAT
mmetsp:Transcript_39064/g.112249  ORF Transcript_39064/g.112249 Transcript_39064/m.112249 type:complete len:321 (+) Transcript_39064:2287-3249(+)